MPRTAPRIAALLLAGLGVLAGLGGCSVGPSHRPPVAVRADGAQPLPGSGSPPAATLPPPALPPLEPGRPTAVSFRDCTQPYRAQLAAQGAAVPPDRDLHFDCGTVRAGAQSGQGAPATLSVLRVSLGPAAPDGGVPLVVVGEPDGEPGTLRAERLATEVPVELLHTLVLVGVDQRGAGPDNPVDCVPASFRANVVDADPFARDPEQLPDLLTTAQRIAQSCSQVLEDALQGFDTTTAALDLERVRQALGVPRLNAVGLGRGSRILAVYADRFPTTTGRLVLDGAPDPTADAVTAAEQRATAAEAAFSAYAADCTSRPACPLGGDPRQALLTLAGRLQTLPLVGADGRRVTAGTAFQAVLAGLDEPTEWPVLSQALAAAANGDPSGVLTLVAPLTEQDSRFDLGLITACNDSSQRVAPAQAAQLVAAWRDRLPLFGALFAQRLLLCTAWPVPTQPAMVGPAAAAPPILVVGTAVDAHTPVIGAQHTAAALDGGVLLTWQGTGHGAYPRTPCITEAVGAFLVAGKPPRSGTVCPP